MKKFIILFTIFTALSFSSFAKDFESSKKLLSSIGKNEPKKDDLEPFDYKKVFEQAETYFKAAKSWKKLKCTPKSGFICTKHTCNNRDSKIFIVLNKKKKTIQRCDGKKCESFPAKFKQTGIFFNIQSEGPIGTLIRVLGNNRYKEITTVGLDAYIANGNCEVLAD